MKKKSQAGGLGSRSPRVPGSTFLPKPLPSTGKAALTAGASQVPLPPLPTPPQLLPQLLPHLPGFWALTLSLHLESPGKWALHSATALRPVGSPPASRLPSPSSPGQVPVWGRVWGRLWGAYMSLYPVLYILELLIHLCQRQSLAQILAPRGLTVISGKSLQPSGLVCLSLCRMGHQHGLPRPSPVWGLSLYTHDSHHPTGPP